MITITGYQESDRDDIIRLVLHCQNDGTRPLVTVEDQPELLHIQEKYIENGGNFWVAKDDGKLAGSIGLINCGNGIGILKKFFVYEPYRGKPHHLGQQLYQKLLIFAAAHEIKTLLLDTPANTNRAHKFYDNAGFVQITKEELPVEYDYPYDNCHFFRLDLT